MAANTSEVEVDTIVDEKGAGEVVSEQKDDDAPEVTVAEKPADAETANDQGTIVDVPSNPPPTFVPLPEKSNGAAASSGDADAQGTVQPSQQQDVNPFEDVDRTANVMVNFIPQTINEEKFHSMFAEFGDIISSKLIIDKYSGRHIGYGFVNYSKLEAAKAAIEKYNGFAIDGKWLKVVFARQSSNGTKRASLHVSGLPIFYTEEEIKKMFAAYSVIDVKLLMSESPSPYLHPYPPPSHLSFLFST